MRATRLGLRWNEYIIIILPIVHFTWDSAVGVCVMLMCVRAVRSFSVLFYAVRHGNKSQQTHRTYVRLVPISANIATNEAHRSRFIGAHTQTANGSLRLLCQCMHHDVAGPRKQAKHMCAVFKWLRDRIVWMWPDQTVASATVKLLEMQEGREERLMLQRAGIINYYLIRFSPLASLHNQFSPCQEHIHDKMDHKAHSAPEFCILSLRACFHFFLAFQLMAACIHQQRDVRWIEWINDARSSVDDIHPDDIYWNLWAHFHLRK